MYNKIIINIHPLGFMWPVTDPFLFCVHHLDFYPKGNHLLGPSESLSGRYLGQDFRIKDGWRMYHGHRIPGFPVHPHRGFETITIVLKGFVDHCDSAGSAGRYGHGDVQWMTAGAGLQHSEMFPLINTDKDNPLELFQIWLNLPKERKFADPYFKMLWNYTIPKYYYKDRSGKSTTIDIISGTVAGHTAPPPAPDSWANDHENEVGIWNIRMDADAEYTIPAASIRISRMLYFFEGDTVNITGNSINTMNAIEMFAANDVVIKNGNKPARLLLLQGKPINEPVVQHGPFAMNSREEINKAIEDYRKTEFGGWPWENNDQVHPANKGRFALYPDGKEDIPEK